MIMRTSTGLEKVLERIWELQLQRFWVTTS